MPSGNAVAASPKLWIRSASSATLPLARKTAVWASAAAPRTASDRATARTPPRERLTASSTSPWECAWPPRAPGFVLAPVIPDSLGNSAWGATRNAPDRCCYALAPCKLNKAD